MHKRYIFLLIISSITISGCETIIEKPSSESEVAYHDNEQFNDFWYHGEAELSHYKLQQARYGEIREGDAVMIFVTEHLDPEAHVKTANEGNNGIPVLKLNAMRTFTTGIYPYSLMTSVFTPVNRDKNPQSLKVSFSAQEWCGHVFEMLNYRNGSYQSVLHSYFEGEADQEMELAATVTEDELWNIIRIDPEKLPVDSFKIIPSLQHVRLKHVPLKTYNARATLADDGKSKTYHLIYNELNREIKILFENTFPYKIISWEEKYPSGFGNKAEILTTTATLDTTIMLDYWNKNAAVDTFYRSKLGLE